ncbi:MAG: phenylalanyl-tRNA synthetase alpha chain [Flavobacteriaceae bacterium]|jgi:phenylalanyl-tRNA synthetase alpha chain
MKEKKSHIHPLHAVMYEAVQIFEDLGFSVVAGPQMEDQWHNFDALNVPKDHPARDMQDTFFVPKKDDEGRPYVLRTHTSSVQIRYMENNQPPFAIIVPGKVFRNEATDATHEAQFHQIEGLMVGENITLAHLRGVLETFLKKFLGEETEMRFRPGFFPFVEPGVEVDIIFKEKWLELLGAGMVHPSVLESAGIDSKKYQGFAFGIGLDRLMMMKYGVSDVRYSYGGDARFNTSII